MDNDYNVVNKNKRVVSSIFALIPMCVCALLCFLVPNSIAKAFLFVGCIVFSILSKKMLKFWDKIFKVHEVSAQ